jgi:ornithine cyclodeaminase
VVLRALPPNGSFIAAVGAFTPRMVELDGALCRHIARVGEVVIDTPEAHHEAGDLLLAGVPMDGLRTLADVVRQGSGPRRGPVLFKSCGWAGWDLALARAVTGPRSAVTP